MRLDWKSKPKKEARLPKPIISPQSSRRYLSRIRVLAWKFQPELEEDISYSLPLERHVKGRKRRVEVGVDQGLEDHEGGDKGYDKEPFP